jgi:hypothetical protein
MGSRTLFVAGPQDMKELNAFIRSLGMYMVSPGPDFKYSDDETVLGRCYVSPIPAGKLKVSGPKYIWYSEVLDPIIPLMRSVYNPPYIRPGDLYWNNDVRELAVQTKPTFQAISRWIRKNWPKPEGDDWHFGPEARRLVFEEGVIATSLVPGVTLTKVPVRSDE